MTAKRCDAPTCPRRTARPCLSNRYLMWPEIVNERGGWSTVTVTFCRSVTLEWFSHGRVSGRQR